MIFSKEKVIFICNPKTASISMSHALKDQFGEADFDGGHEDFETHLVWIEDELNISREEVLEEWFSFGLHTSYQDMLSFIVQILPRLDFLKVVFTSFIFFPISCNFSFLFFIL